MKTIGVIGGDLRQISLAEEFKNNGFTVFTYGLSELGTQNEEDAFEADIIIFPIPVNVADKLNAPFEKNDIYLSHVISRLNKNSKIFGGYFPIWVKTHFNSEKMKFFDYSSRGEFLVYNAISTAEGAIEIAVSETPYTIHESKILLIGYGNISKALSRILNAMCADVTVALRDEKQRAEASSVGLKTIHTDMIFENASKFDIIFNTVPSLILTDFILKSIRPNTLIIDLASKPGGVDFESARFLSRRVIWALGLPGKVAPVTSGKIIKKTVENILKEEKEELSC